MKKRFLCVSMLVCLCLTACGTGGTDVLPVKSVDYEGLTELVAAEPDEKMIDLWNSFTVNPYYGYFCHLSLDGDDLLISAEMPPETDSYTLKGNNGYFVGTDIGEFDGWVKYFPYYSVMAPEIVGEPADVVDENCLGFIKVDSTRGYLLTWVYQGGILEAYEGVSGGVYELRFPNADNDWSCTRIADIKGLPRTYTYDADSGILYIATTTSLLAVSTSERTCTKLADLSLWDAAGVTSLVQLNGKLYAGMPMGVYEYDLATGGTKWYPMPYEKLIPKEKWNPRYDEDDARMYEELGFVVY